MKVERDFPEDVSKLLILFPVEQIRPRFNGVSKNS